MTSIPDNVKKFLEHKVSDGFGCSRDKIVAGCKNYGRFKYWLDSDESRINQLLDEVEKAGMSAELFAAKEIQEGYNSSWGWHNHTVPQGDPITDAQYVVRYTLEVSEGEYSLAWDDPGGGTVGVVPQSVRDEGNAHYATLPPHTIGRAYLAMTAAAVWAMYYPDALSASVNGVQDYADPISGVMDLINEWGGNLDTSKSNSSNSSQKPGNSSNSSKNKKKSGTGFYYIQNDTLWLLNGNGSGNITRTNGTGTSSGSSDSSGSGSSSNTTSNFSDPEDQKLWNETENENPSGGDSLTDHTRHVRAFIMKKFGLTEAHGWRQDDDGTGHGHNSGMAVDFMVGFDTNVNSELGQKIADYFQNNFDALGCYYLIWQQHFYMNVDNKYGTANTWNPMEDRGSPTQNHMDHVHVSFAR